MNSTAEMINKMEQNLPLIEIEIKEFRKFYENKLELNGTTYNVNDIVLLLGKVSNWFKSLNVDISLDCYISYKKNNFCFHGTITYGEEFHTSYYNKGKGFSFEEEYTFEHIKDGRYLITKSIDEHSKRLKRKADEKNVY